MTPAHRLPVPPTRRLPMIVAPFREETLNSYLERLAAANFMTGQELRRLLAPDLPPHTRMARMHLRVLAGATGRSPSDLCWALPELRPQLPGFVTTSGPLPLAAPRLAATIHLACRRCVAARGLTGTVRVWGHPDRSVCLRHRLWIGEPGWGWGSEQIALDDHPEILRAQVNADKLVRRHGREPAVRALRAAANTLTGLDLRKRNSPVFEARNLRLSRTYDERFSISRAESAYHAAIFPEVVAMAGLLADPGWRQLAVSWTRAETERFIVEFYQQRPDDVPYLHGALGMSFLGFRLTRSYGTPCSMAEAVEMARLEEVARLLTAREKDLTEIDELVRVACKSKEAGTKRLARSYLRRFTADQDAFARNAIGRILASIAGAASLRDLVDAANRSASGTPEEMAPMVEAIRSVLFMKRYTAAAVLNDLSASLHEELRELADRAERFLGRRATEKAQQRSRRHHYRLPVPLPDPV